MIGAGAAGLLAATRAAERGLRTVLLEKNARPGIKILMSGGTRCNLTHATDRRGIVSAFVKKQGSFLQSALAALPPQELVRLVEAEGVPTKVEDTGKIFPVSNKADDVLHAFLNRLMRSGASLALGQPVVACRRLDGQFELQTPQGIYTAPNLIVTTGGRSYPGSGTVGDGYVWAEQFGHTIVRPTPALTPITTDAAWVRELQGITLNDVRVQVVHSDEPRPLAERRGSLLFAHFGLSGPAILDVSRVVSGHADPRSLSLRCDFLPSCGEDALRSELQQAIAADGKRPVAAWLADQLPRRLAEALFGQVGLTASLRLAELPRAGRQSLIQALKRLEIPISGTLGFKKAEVTAGGVALDEVDSRNMQSKLVPGLYFAGEVLDLDGPIGGFNFQAAFSTGWLAGSQVAQSSP